jgi:hypothetical protein
MFNATEAHAIANFNMQVNVKIGKLGIKMAMLRCCIKWHLFLR